MAKVGDIFTSQSYGGQKSTNTESWAGGTITGGAPNPSGGGRGSWIPVQDVPNAPKTVSMPGYHPQNAPAIRYDYVKGAPDMKGRGESLMQKELPGSFEEAGNIRTAAAGKGQEAYAGSQMQAAKTMGAAGQNLGSAIMGVSSVMDKIATQARESKDETDKIMARNAIETHDAEVKRITDTETPDKWGELKAEADKNLTKATSGLGATKRTHDIIQATVGGTIGSADQKLKYAGGLKTIQQAQQLASDLVKDGRDQKDYNKAEQGVASLEAQKVISADQAKEMRAKNQFLQGVDTTDQALLSSKTATMLKEQAAGVREGKSSKDFPVLNTNPALAADLEYRAGEALKKHKASDLQEITDAIEHGDLRTPDEIRKAAKGKFFSYETVEFLAKSGNIVVEHSDANHAAVRKAISDYNYFTDEGGAQYEAIKMQIRTTVEKERRGPYDSLLDTKLKRGEANKTDTPLEKSAKNVIDKIHFIDEHNMLPATDKERELLTTARRKMNVLKSGVDPDTKDPLTAKTIAKWTPTTEEKAAWEANGTRVRELQEATDEAIKKDPNMKPGDLWEAVFENTPQAGNYEKNAGNSTETARRAEKVDVLDREKRIAEALNLPAGMGAVPPRDLSAGGRGGSAAYKKALAGSGASSEVRATAYTKDEPGGNQVASRKGELFTMEKYAAGKVPYVSMAMDDNSQFQGKFVTFSAHPNVVFKVEDRGGAFVGKGDSAIDIAYDDNHQATNYTSHGTIKEVSASEAAEIAGTSGQKLSGNVPAIPAGADAVASIDKTTNTGARTQMAQGTLNIGGTPYEYKSGGYGRGSLPPGKYVVTEHMPSRNTPGMVVGDVGFSFALSDAYDRRVGGTRTLLRIHPDGGTSGTAGCIGIVGGKEVQKQFRDDMTAQIRANGGKMILQVG